MANLLDTFAGTVGLVFPLSDVLASCDVKKGKKSKFYLLYI